MVATLNQPQYSPWPLEEQVVAIFAGINGYLDDVPPAQVPRFQEELREFLRAEETVYAGIRDARDLSDEVQEAARAQVEKFKGSFSVREEAGLP
jgi:F-type H+-transporting ATPase subunit alpha